MASPSRYSSLELGTQQVLKNRVVVPPMASSTADLQGFVTEATIAHYSALADSGAGLVIVEYTFVHPSGRSEENQLGIHCDEQIVGLTQIAKAIHQRGAIAGIQLTHSGGKSSRALAGGNLMAPSAIPVPVKEQTLECPRAMDSTDIELWKNAFESAAARAVEAGFDLIELHSAHGYGLNQWLSPLTNHRNDSYGGELANRVRLLAEILVRIRQNHPTLAISVRIPGQDFLEGGLAVGDMVAVSEHLRKIGVNVLHVSSGIGGWRRPAIRVGEGYLVAEATVIHRAVSIPVIGVGGIESGDYIDRGLEEGLFSLATVGRAILRDPIGWRENHLSFSSREPETGRN